LNKQVGTQILATRSAVEGVEDLLLRPVGDFRFVGKTTPLPVVEIMAKRSTASDAQQQLCAEFNRAIETLGEGRWPEAAHAFASVLERFPGDRPAKYHLDRCQRHLASGSLPETPLLVALDAK
jgi:adenylate cyclase